jgi:hypothetical protein
MGMRAGSDVSSNGHNGNGKTASKRRDGAGNGGIVPPVAHRFKPGNPGGPGRPLSLTRIIRERLAKPDKQHGTRADALIALAERRARKGDFRFFKEIIDRNDGKVPDRLANADGSNIELRPIRLDGDREL